MKPLKTVVLILLGCAIGMPIPGEAAEGPATSPGSQGIAAQTKTGPEFDLPIYTKPKGAKRGGRVDGNSRGDVGKLPAIFVLAPSDHVGMTTYPQPTLYWHLSKLTTAPIQFVLDRDLRESPVRYDPQHSRPVRVEFIGSPTKPGVQRISLKDLGVTLEPGVTYKWFIRVILDPKEPIPDIVANGFIEYVPLVEALQLHLSYPGPRDVLVIAKAGLWYDAIMAVSEAIESGSVDSIFFRKQRAALLRQEGLSEAAKYDYPE